MALILHLGAHKTATTHLQKSLQLAVETLAEAGIYYAGPDLLRTDLCPLVDGVGAKGPQGHAKAQRASAVLHQAQADFPHLLVSDENLLGGTNRMGLFDRKGRIYPLAAPRLQRIIALTGAKDVTVALSVRDPAAFMVSAFSLQITRGHELDIRDYLCGRDVAALSWSELAERLLGVEGVSRLVLWRYEDYGALRPQILARLLTPELVPAIPEPPPANMGLTQMAYDWLIARAMEDSDADLRSLVREAWRKFPKTGDRAGLRLLEDDEYRRSAEAYAADLAALRAMTGVEFLAP